MDEQQGTQGQSLPLDGGTAPLSYSASLPEGVPLGPAVPPLVRDRTGKPRLAPLTLTYTTSGLPPGFTFGGTAS